MPVLAKRPVMGRGCYRALHSGADNCFTTVFVNIFEVYHMPHNNTRYLS
ncbi:hypothetical protein Plhal703r1_c63g0167311 [Plasmopara halstedii]